MRSKIEVEEHLEWFKVHCQRYVHEQREAAVSQLMTLLWVLGDDPGAAREKAEVLWDESRENRWRA